MIKITDKEAATYQTNISGWVAGGRFFGKDERAARWNGCTHVACKKCGVTIDKMYTICGQCQKNEAIKRFDKMPKKEWDGKTPLLLLDSDLFFDSEDELLDYCLDFVINPQELRLIICKPIYAEPIDPGDYYSDDLSDDSIIPDKLRAAFDCLNEEISQVLLSWCPGEYAAIIREDALHDTNSGNIL